MILTMDESIFFTKASLKLTDSMVVMFNFLDGLYALVNPHHFDEWN